MMLPTSTKGPPIDIAAQEVRICYGEESAAGELMPSCIKLSATWLGSEAEILAVHGILLDQNEAWLREVL